MQITVVRSRRRFRTVSARIVNDELIVHAPAALSQERLDRIVADLKVKLERRRIKTELDRRQDLFAIARELNARYFDNRVQLRSIEYVTNQETKFGCCHFPDARIRISHKVGLMPAWVRDYVIVHEMAHVLEPNHGPSFWGLVSRYKLAERARGYLMAAGLYQDQPQPEDA